MFDTREGNALQELAKNGAEPNAFTANAITGYHFDCTELSYEYNETGCLLTNAQVKAYDEWRYDALGTNFRQYNKSQYPKASTKIITETPNLKDYMD